MDKEVKIFFIIIFICMIVISIISVGLILKRRKVLVIVGLVILTVELIVAIIPCVLDYGNALNNRYEVTSGIALNNSKSSKVPWRTAEILEDTSGRKIRLPIKNIIFLGYILKSNEKISSLKQKENNIHIIIPDIKSNKLENLLPPMI